MGWFSFLVRHIVRPYLPARFPGIVPSGLAFVNSSKEIPRSARGVRRYLDHTDRPYSVRLAELANSLLKKTADSPVRRLERIYDYLYIDEVQDLRGNDLNVLSALMRSSLKVFVTGDVRQSLLATSRSDRANKRYDGERMADWFAEQAAKGLCSVTYSSVSRRFGQQIADLSDLIYPDLQVPRTVGAFSARSGHDGCFIVDRADLDAYCASVHPAPTILRHSIRANVGETKLELLNYGQAKAITRDHVVIVPTGPIRSWLTGGPRLEGSAAFGFYVAVTRARYSVAIVVDDALGVEQRLRREVGGIVQRWSPHGLA